MALPTNRSSALKDSEENEYPYSESDTPKMLDKILEKGLIRLPEMTKFLRKGLYDFQNQTILKKSKGLMIPNTASTIGS